LISPAHENRSRGCKVLALNLAHKLVPTHAIDDLVLGEEGVVPLHRLDSVAVATIRSHQDCYCP
jgi:hypothetical protein